MNSFKPRANGDDDNAPEHILVVDDDRTMLLIVREMLRKVDEDSEITLAESAEEARTAMEYIRFSLVISDVRMPGESGIELLRWAKTAQPEVPFILMTGRAEPAISHDAVQAGAHYFLSKPFAVSVLKDTVQDALKAGKLQRQNARLRWELASHNSRLRQEVIEAQIQNQQLFFATLTALANAIDARDAYTCAHSTQVSHLSLSLARRMELDWELQNAVEAAAQLHDIGKIAVPEQILLKPARLTDEEFEKIKEHPVHGARILQPLPDCELILPAVRHHHERYDGTGYPDRLAGEEIPLLARVISVCDTWSAMRTNRPYRPTMPFETSLEIIGKERGRQFDPAICDAFIEMANEPEFTELSATPPLA